MIILRELETQIDLIDANDIYGDIDLIVRQRLEDNLVGRCKYGGYIISIKDIIERDGCSITDTSNTGHGYVSVRFTVEILTVSRDELVIGETLLVEDNRIQCLSPEGNVAMLLRRLPGIRSIKKGQLIPIRAWVAEATIGQSQISINGMFYLVPKKAATIYNISELNQTEKQELAPLLEKITDLEALAKKADKKTYKFFNDLLYPFQTRQKSEGVGKDMKKLNASGLVMRSEKQDKGEPTIHVLKKAPKGYTIVDDQSPVVVYQMFLSDYINHLQTVVLLCNTYKTEDVRKKHKNIWEIYKEYKQLVNKA